MRNLQFAFGIMLGAIMVVGGGTARPALAQEGNASVTVESTGAVVHVEAPWRVEESQAPRSGAGEVLRFTGSNDTLLLGFIPAEEELGDPIAATRGQMDVGTEPITDVDRGATYALQASSTAGVPYGHFSLVFRDRTAGITEVLSYIAPVSTFATGLETLRTSIAIDGEPIFDGVDGHSLQALLADAAGSGDAAADASLAPLPAANDAAPLPVTSDTAPESGEMQVGRGGPVSWLTYLLGAREMSPEGGEEAVASDAGENSWVSPTYGTTVSWDARWKVAPEIEAAGTGSGDLDAEFVSLVQVDSPEVQFGVTVVPVSVRSIESWVEGLSTQASFFPTTTIVMTATSGTGGAVVWYDPHWVFIHDFSLSDDGSAVVWRHLRARTDAFRVDFEAASSGITMNGEAIFTNVVAADLDAVQP